MSSDKLYCEEWDGMEMTASSPECYMCQHYKNCWKKDNPEPYFLEKATISQEIDKVLDMQQTRDQAVEIIMKIFKGDDR